MDNEVLLELKPKYIDFIRFLYNIPLGFLFMCCVAIIDWLIPMFMYIQEPQLWYVYIWYVYIAINVLLWILLTGFLMFLDRKNYEVTNYKIYNDRIEFEEGYINHKYTTIRMVDIKEIHLEQNFIQRQAELGTIRFITAANNSTASTGVCFRDIQNSMAIYAKVKQIHENS